jgi:hypothetical protein
MGECDNWKRFNEWMSHLIIEFVNGSIGQRAWARVIPKQMQ